MSKIKTEEMFKNEMKIINLNIRILSKYTNTKIKILVKDIRCDYEWEVAPRVLLRGSGCPQCNHDSKRKTKEQFIDEMKHVNPNIEVLGDYIGSKSYILVKNKICGHGWDTTTPSSLLNGTNCTYCYSSKKKGLEKFKEEMKIKNPYIEVLGEYINNATPILIKDKRCNHEWNTSNPNKLLLGGGCPECAKFKRWENRYI